LFSVSIRSLACLTGNIPIIVEWDITAAHGMVSHVTPSQIT